MPSEKPYVFTVPPVAIGGVGGSGTRLITEVLQALGFFMGDDLNGPRDNITFSFLLKRADLWPIEDHVEEIDAALDIFFNAMYFHQPLTLQQQEFITKLGALGRPPHAANWPSNRVEVLLKDISAKQTPGKWGWKEPNTHIFLPRLNNRVAELKYIHVVRHGLDMAFSDNQSQAQLWGRALTGRQLNINNPMDAFTYWCLSHERILEIGKTMGSRFYLLNYDSFCQKPEKELGRLLNFLDMGASPSLRQKIIGKIDVPASIGRHLRQPMLPITQEHLLLLKQLGFTA